MGKPHDSFSLGSVKYRHGNSIYNKILGSKRFEFYFKK